jgi:hypothetical protein
MKIARVARIFGYVVLLAVGVVACLICAFVFVLYSYSPKESEPDPAAIVQATRDARVKLNRISGKYSIPDTWDAVRELTLCRIIVVGRSRRDIESDLPELGWIEKGWTSRDGTVVHYFVYDVAIQADVADYFYVTYDDNAPEGKAVEIRVIDAMDSKTPGFQNLAPDRGPDHRELKYVCMSKGLEMLTPVGQVP